MKQVRCGTTAMSLQTDRLADCVRRPSSSIFKSPCGNLDLRDRFPTEVRDANLRLHCCNEVCIPSEHFRCVLFALMRTLSRFFSCVFERSSFFFSVLRQGSSPFRFTFSSAAHYSPSVRVPPLMLRSLFDNLSPPFALARTRTGSYGDVSCDPSTHFFVSVLDTDFCALPTPM